MQLNDQPQEIEYLGTIKKIEFEGPKRTLPAVDWKDRLNAHGGFKDFEGPTVKRLQFGPGSSRHLPSRADIHISKETYAMSSYKSPLVEQYMAMYPNGVPVASNRPLGKEFSFHEYNNSNQI